MPLCGQPKPLQRLSIPWKTRALLRLFVVSLWPL
jgi:hypothetical protein